MPFQIVRQPVASPLSFSRSDDAAILTQAAVLLATGAQLRGDNKRFRLAPAGISSGSAPLLDEDLKLLGLPALAESPGRIDSAHNRQLLFSRYKLPIPTQAVLTETAIEDKNVFGDVARIHFSEGSSKSAIDMMELCLRHPNELVRVSAAAAYSEHSSELDRLVRILEAGTRSAENLLRSISATALSFCRSRSPAPKGDARDRRPTRGHRRRRYDHAHPRNLGAKLALVAARLRFPYLYSAIGSAGSLFQARPLRLVGRLQRCRQDACGYGSCRPQRQKHGPIRLGASDKVPSCR